MSADVPFLGEIMITSFGFPPKGWAFCDGRMLPINQNQALFSLLGTTYGGDGRVTFSLPDLRGCTPMHVGSGHNLGERSGEQSHTLSMGELPAHVHDLQATSAQATTSTPSASVLLAQSTASSLYGPADSNIAAMAPSSPSPVGGSQAHPNMQPFLVLSFCIALVGVFPSRN